MSKTIREVALEALKIHEEHARAAEMDAGFDGGEFSGPAHSEMAFEAVEELAIRYGFTSDEIGAEFNKIIAEETEAGYDKLAGGWV